MSIFLHSFVSCLCKRNMCAKHLILHSLRWLAGIEARLLLLYVRVDIISVYHRIESIEYMSLCKTGRGLFYILQKNKSTVHVTFYINFENSSSPFPAVFLHFLFHWEERKRFAAAAFAATIQLLINHHLFFSLHIVPLLVFAMLQLPNEIMQNIYAHKYTHGYAHDSEKRYEKP